MKDIDRNAIIKNDKNTMTNALKLDFRFNICLVEIIKEAKIQNCVKKIISKTQNSKLRIGLIIVSKFILCVSSSP